MAAANCQACVVKVGTLPNPVGNQNEPFGACRNCSAFACGHHGHRDPNVPEFMCVECDPKLLIASAATALAGQGVAPNQVQDLLSGYHRNRLPPEWWAVASLEDFQRRRPGYGAELIAHAQEIHWNPGWMPFDTQGPGPARNLLVLAGLIAKRLRLPERDVPAPLRRIWASVE